MAVDICIVGLGNPGDSYQLNRHNLGFMVLDALAKRWVLNDFTKNRYNRSLESTTDQGNKTTVLLKPQVFMNLSGESLIKLKGQIKPEKFLIIYDDIDLPLGSFRFRAKGSAGSHNGMKSIIKILSTQEVPRIRIGIRPEFRITDLSRFVLGNLTASEQTRVEEIMPQIFEAIDTWITSSEL